MYDRSGNLSGVERIVSALGGVALAWVGSRNGSPGVRIATVLAGAGLLTRAAAGHCGVKAVLQGRTSVREALRDEWNLLRRQARSIEDGVVGSPRHERRSRAVDESVEESFPASDAPASHLPDEPPVNAQAKWDAVRRAGR